MGCTQASKDAEAGAAAAAAEAAASELQQRLAAAEAALRTSQEIQVRPCLPARSACSFWAGSAPFLHGVSMRLSSCVTAMQCVMIKCVGRMWLSAHPAAGAHPSWRSQPHARGHLHVSLKKPGLPHSAAWQSVGPYVGLPMVQEYQEAVARDAAQASADAIAALQARVARMEEGTSEAAPRQGKHIALRMPGKSFALNSKSLLRLQG